MTIKKFSCYVIEPHFYDALNWDINKIMRFLEFIRLHVNESLLKHKYSKYYLIEYSDFLGNPFPAIGVVNDDPVERRELEDFNTLYDRVEGWVNTIGLDTIDRKSKEYKVISWEILREVKHFPKE